MSTVPPDRSAPFADVMRDLVARAGGDATRVRVEADAAEQPSATASAIDGTLVLRGTDPVACARAFSRYLAAAHNQRITWESPRIEPAGAPWADGDAAVTTPFGIRYHFNVVTHGYSTAFWDWPRWERELDWMAMHGVTHPLILTGYEAVLAETLRRHGVADEDAWAWVGSAAHTPWMAMGGMHSFGGPLPRSWMQRRTALARRILDRARELGMTPVLPITGGHVPPSLAPDARTIEWQGWATPVLEATSDEYRALVRTFLDVQRELLGDRGPEPVLSLDPFIESLPPFDDEASLADAGRGYVEAIAAVEPDATWLLQGWPFHYHRDFWTDERVEAFLSGIPSDKLLLIDLWGEHAPMWRGGMHGRRWIWTAIHNFGGRFALMGDLRGLARDVGELRETAPARLEGVGLAPEAIENNAVYYELAADVGWGDVSIDAWLDDFALQRYGTEDDAAREAWRTLGRTLYGPGRTQSIPSPVYARPWDAQLPYLAQRLAGEGLPAAPVRMSANIDAENDPSVLGDLPDIAAAARALIGVDAALRDAQGRDIADLTGHVLAQGCRMHIRGILAAFTRGDADDVRTHAGALRADLLDLERLTATLPDSRVETWIEAARAWGDDDESADLLERDARSLVSVWGHQTSGLHDYSGRHWSGLIGGLYLPRWEAWANWLADAAARDAEPDVSVLRRRIVEIEERWRGAIGTTPHPSAHADTLAVASDILDGLEGRRYA